MSNDNHDALTGYVDPTREAFELFKNLPRDVPVNMINFLRFRKHARYEDGHELAGNNLSGAEAYANYGRESGPIFQRVGGKIIWRGEPKLMLIGPAAKRGEEAWDMTFIANYPTAGAFLEMVTDPDYRIAVKHRQAAVADSRLIRCHPQEDSDVFG
ncbi:DUF1330 domain-containing protein [Kordiimonas sp. SCSIO 12610]|uniref:DUF1330 domain-containing protein n=1 Tax=Kordiimonas sp. SCSIO 12610 TaxID=2829597 RepID=UPI0022015467|nr:DUF1330 domain-containing protein [Kordiimonas sp. SCSIO 12610]